MSNAAASIDCSQEELATGTESVPAGYKRTEVGEIPEDWEVASLRCCLLAALDYGVNAPAIPFDEKLPTYLRITDIGKNRYQPAPRVSVNHPSSDSYLLTEGDLVFARTGASVGNSYLYRSSDGSLVFAGFLVRARPNPLKLNPKYLAYTVQSERFWKWVDGMSSRSGQPGINAKEYGTFRLPRPEICEQHAIAEALSDVDSLLESLDALITKKRAIKQAAMQQLLTGETRLPGFTKEWEPKLFGEVVSIRNEKILPCHVDLGTICVELEHIASGEGQLLRTITSQDAVSSKYKFSSGDVLFGRLRPYLRKYWLTDCYGICTTEIWPLVPCPGKMVSGFLFGLIQSEAFIEAANVSYGTHMPRADWGVMSGFDFLLPSPEEQTAIAAVLSDMDVEITALQQRRDKTHAIKQAMMQQLLTGRVRLV